MPFNPYPSFHTKSWRPLYESYIHDLSTLKTAANDAALVFVDVEPWSADLSKPAEIGLSLLPAHNYSRMSSKMPQTLDAISDMLQLETHWIQLAGRERREEHREGQRFGQKHTVQTCEVEQAISDIIRDFIKQHNYDVPSTSGALPTRMKVPLILAGFNLDFELRILSSLSPSVLQHFTSWLDIQEVVGEAYSSKTVKYLDPGLQETLVACGIQACTSIIHSAHNAATDTVRAAAVFAHLMVRHHNGDVRDISVSPPRMNNVRINRRLRGDPGKKQLWFGTRPMPQELYPYGARVSRMGEDMADLHAQRLMDIFAIHEPVAVGLGKGKRYGWVCLSSMKALECFLQNVDGSMLSDGYVWKAVSDYDPNIVPAEDWGKLKLRRKLELEELVDGKRAERQARREEQQRQETETTLIDRLAGWTV